jgi:hypothetical protein
MSVRHGTTIYFAETTSEKRLDTAEGVIYNYIDLRVVSLSSHIELR